jgi:murein DD-endopeptidase MepM/ murein hydrolase activator NlpD
MRKNMRNNSVRKIKYTFFKTSVLMLFFGAVTLPSLKLFEHTGNNMFDVYLNGTLVGQVADEETAENCMTKARYEVAKESDDLVFLKTELALEGREVLFGEISREEDVVEMMQGVMDGSREDDMQQAYTVKINNFTVNLSSMDEVQQLLQAAVNKYDSTDSYGVEMIQDADRELNVLTTRVYSEIEAKEEELQEEKARADASSLLSSGIFAVFQNAVEAVQIEEEKDLSEYNRGLIHMNFGDTIEIVESYMPQSHLSGLAAAIEEVTKDQETNKIYEVVAGDTLGEIAEEHNMSIEDVVAMNGTLENENSVIRVGDELIISVPEPELSVERQEELYYEEDYDSDIIYVDNDDWYTTEQVTRQQPSAGHRRVVAIVSYRNDTVTNTEIIKEDVDMEAVPKIVERGTKIPPTYIKPISGGRMSSGFGGRKAPKKGASTNHKGIDWATPTGTAVMASCGGVVTKAGWGSGYGYVVYIQHPDGKETRYGHLSKVLVSSGQKVSQGQKIALSGNTGVSTGPHVHFEIRIGGSAVNPLNYLN